MDAIADMEAILFDIKETLKEQDYIVLMDKLQAMANNNPRIEDKKHRIRYSIKTSICYIEDSDQYKDIKKDLYYDSTETYSESDESINEDYEKVKVIETDGYFYCYSYDIMNEENHTPYQLLRMIGEAKKHTVDYYLNPGVFQDHQREVQDYYSRYLKNWDEWVRIVNESAMGITEIDYIGEEEFMVV